MESKPRRLCISICEQSVGTLPDKIAQASAAGDLVELRLDCFDQGELERNFARLRELLASQPIPTIVTLRPAEQGGLRAIDIETRRAFWKNQGFGLPAQYYDLELDLAELFAAESRLDQEPIDWARVICSFHDFRDFRGGLGELYARMRAVPARILKIAVTVDDAVECVELFQLLERARAEGREIIVIGMGAAGFATRVIGPSRGAFLTYAALDDSGATAPGQPTAHDLKTLYRIDSIERGTQQLGLVGFPVAHSLSPLVHNTAFGVTGVKAVYLPYQVRDLDSFFRRMVHPRTREIDWNLRGLSVTAPHKTSLIDQLEWIEPAARQIGAVNTIVVEDDRVLGYNTDKQAAIRSLEQKFGSLRRVRVAVIGAGGMARTVLHGLQEARAQCTIFARDSRRAATALRDLNADCRSLHDAGFADFDVVINATPLGTLGHLESETPATTQQLRGARLAYDLVYNPIETRFLRAASEAGCETLGGLSMFVAQAAEQFQLWTGHEAPVIEMREAAQAVLLRHGQARDTTDSN